VIDARDMGAWMVRLLEDGQQGAFHACSPEPPFSWAEAVQVIVDAVGPEGTKVTWVDPAVVAEAGVPEGAFPLWSADDSDAWVMACDPSRAYGTGLTPRPLADTVRDTLAWTRTVEAPPGTGVTPETESDLLARVRAAG
jgi:2'-hydroxyisoflavone reductase